MRWRIIFGKLIHLRIAKVYCGWLLAKGRKLTNTYISDSIYPKFSDTAVIRSKRLRRKIKNGPGDHIYDCLLVDMEEGEFTVV